MTGRMSGARWTIVIPVKEAERGKSRLTVDGIDRVDLARAVALDTISAAAACAEVEHVIVVTNDREVAAASAAQEARFEVCAEGVGGGLDAAIAIGMEHAGNAAPRAALLGDLPALRPEDLGAALRLAAVHERTVVSDAEGTGSTMVTAVPGAPWTSGFGADSFARHMALGCVPLDIPDASTLRRDVDTADQLDAAAGLGLGVHTAGLFGVAPRRNEGVSESHTAVAGCHA